MKNNQRKVIFEVMGSRSTKYGGVETFLHLLVEDSQEFEYHFIYNDKPCSNQYLIDLAEDNVKIHEIDTRKWKFFINSYRFIFMLLVYRPVIVHFHFSDSFVLWSIFAKLFGAKVIKTNHCCIVVDGYKQVKSFCELTLKRRILLLGGKIYSILDGIISVSKYVDNQFHSIFGDKIQSEIIYLGTQPAKRMIEEEKNLLRHQLKINETQKVITSILFADIIKGCDILLNALPAVTEDYVCLIVGLDENKLYTQKMHQIAKELGIERKIRWIGVTDEVYKYLNITDLYIQPSRTEALSLAAVEAASYGIPVIASNVGGLPEITACTFEKESRSSLSHKINNILNDNESMLSYRTKSIESWNKNFNILVGIRKTHELYKRVIC